VDTSDSAGALTIAEFCAAFNVGRTFLYAEIKSGRLSARKAGSKTLILRSEAVRWAQSLPKLQTGSVS
jgi:excisionase family DNA binding protein